MFIKICGTTSEEDALLSVALGADAIGFIFATSPRQVAPTRVADIVKRLPPDVMTVGVFRNEPKERVVDIMRQTGLHAAQLHGDEHADDVMWVAGRVPFTINVLPAGHPGLENPEKYGAHMTLVDAVEPGSGKAFDWRMVDGVSSRTRLILAGGLTADNVADAIATAKPFGVDVVTGVEAEPGRKDPGKLRAFIQAARDAAPMPYESDNETNEPFDWQND